MTDTTERLQSADIESREDIERLVETFYTGVFRDPVLGPIFVDIVKLDLPRHMPIMCDFWENILFNARKYPGGMMMVHFQVHEMTSLEPHHFQRWLDYWVETVERFFEGPRANLAKMHASRVAGMMAGRFQQIPGGPAAHAWTDDPTPHG
jgi:hemoglobin